MALNTLQAAAAQTGADDIERLAGLGLGRVEAPQGVSYVMHCNAQRAQMR